MSAKHPIIAITGSSGAGTSTVKMAFEHMFIRENVTPAVVEGDSFHRFDREEMKKALEESGDRRSLSHFGEAANLFDKLEELFHQYGETGTGQEGPGGAGILQQHRDGVGAPVGGRHVRERVLI